MWNLKTDGVVKAEHITLADVVVSFLIQGDCREPGVGSANRSGRDRLGTMSKYWILESLSLLFNCKCDLSSISLLSLSSGVSLLFTFSQSLTESEISERVDDARDSSRYGFVSNPL